MRLFSRPCRRSSKTKESFLSFYFCLVYQSTTTSTPRQVAGKVAGVVGPPVMHMRSWHQLGPTLNPAFKEQ